MSIIIYNTLTQRKEEFIPLTKNKVKMYVCGPTVYNYIHIGNARPAVFFDTVRRYFLYNGYEVDYILNFTDVDDKIIKKANELKISVQEVTDKFINAYLEDIKSLNILPATHNPRVTENIKEIIAAVEKLITKNAAYQVNGDVYFATDKFSEYGKLSHQALDELKMGARIEVDERKLNPLDFALWKGTKEGEIAWESPWGFGRPGWHIECSVMSMKYLGETIDIHGGGSDLIFPHHENEIAQSECLSGKKFANYWMHNGFIQLNNEKMSKSLGNIVLVKDLLEKYTGDVLRFYLLSVHYRTPLTLNEEILIQAKNSLERIKIAKENLTKQIPLSSIGEVEEEVTVVLENIKNKLEKEMNDDFNTANAITVWFELVKESNIYLAKNNIKKEAIEKFLDLYNIFQNILGISWEEEKSLDEEYIVELIEQRNRAKSKKDWQTADMIRAKLLESGIQIEDTPQGVRWRRI